MNAASGPERVGGTIAEHNQHSKAVDMVELGRDGRLALPGYAVTAYVRRVDFTEGQALHVIWFLDHLTDELIPGEMVVGSDPASVVGRAWTLLTARRNAAI